jgi:hypothetical protein
MCKAFDNIVNDISEVLLLNETLLESHAFK